jgi:hypothetical protein
MARSRRSADAATATSAIPTAEQPAPSREHRLVGLEPDNLLAFLAFLGLLRALEAVDAEAPLEDRLAPRVSWDVDRPPLRPRLHLARALPARAVAERAAVGVERLARAHDFGGRPDLDHRRDEARAVLDTARGAAAKNARDEADLLAALMSDAALEDDQDPTTATVRPTPLCLLFGQGHQHFLERLARVPATTAPPPRGRGEAAIALDAADTLAEALFSPWHHRDPTSAFRWDPHEDVRYARMAGDPTDPAYKIGTQHGANRLAAVGLAALTLAPTVRSGRVWPAIVGGAFDRDGFSFAWPIHRIPVTLAGIRGLLAHPNLRQAGGLSHLGVDEVRLAHRISVGKFMNFTRARPIEVG